jgi:hypothetical protein
MQLASLGVLSASDPAVVAQLRQKHPQLGELPGGGGRHLHMPTPGEYDMPATYGGDHPDFMRIYQHAQLAGDCRALAREKTAAPNGGRNEHCQLFGSAFPTGPKEERALSAKRPRLLLWRTPPQCAAPAVVLPTASRQRPGSWPSSEAECAAGETPQVRPVAARYKKTDLGQKKTVLFVVFTSGVYF